MPYDIVDAHEDILLLSEQIKMIIKVLQDKKLLPQERGDEDADKTSVQ